MLTAIALALVLALSGQEFVPAATLVVAAYAPVMVIEAFFTAAAIGLVLRVKPELLDRTLFHLAEETAE